MTGTSHRVSLRARPAHQFAYRGSSLLVTDQHGGIGDGLEGLFFENTRVLSRLRLMSDGDELIPVAASPVDGHAHLRYLEIQPPRQERAAKAPRRPIVVDAARFVGPGMRERLTLSNHDPRDTFRFELQIDLAADFADIREAEKGHRQQDAPVEASWDERRRELTFRYQHPDLDLATVVAVATPLADVRWERDMLRLPIELAPHDDVSLELAVEPLFDGVRHAAPDARFDQSRTELDAVVQRLSASAPRLTTTNATVSAAWQTAVQDLASLPLGLPEGPAMPSAGVPLYQEAFGRDALTIAWQALMAMPEMMRDTLRANAALQGRRIDDWLDEEPGKMLHQARRGPLSRLGIDPFTRYYGDYATAPDFLIMLGQYAAWTNDVSTVRQLLPAARAAIDWLRSYADIDGDGFIEYVTRSSGGVKNQGWKDSDEAIVDERGDIVPNPIATSELQGYWYAGLQQAAVAFVLAGDRAYPLDLLRDAGRLKRRFDAAFWMPGEHFYALALGPAKRQIRSIASNTGHLLATGIVPRHRAAAVVDRLMQPDLFSGWGIRTLSADHPAYHPFSYHLGTVWPVENATFALGLARYGFTAEMHRLAEGIFAGTELFEGHRLPEAVGGFARDADHPHPGVYGRSNEPQGWSASAIVLLIQVILGMRPIAPLRLLVVDPHLPAWIPDLRLEGLRVGDASVDLRFWRDGSGRTRYRVTGRRGRLHVVRQPPPNSERAGIMNRAVTALRSTMSGGRL